MATYSTCVAAQTPRHTSPRLSTRWAVRRGRTARSRDSQSTTAPRVDWRMTRSSSRMAAVLAQCVAKHARRNEGESPSQYWSHSSAPPIDRTKAVHEAGTKRSSEDRHHRRPSHVRLGIAAMSVDLSRATDATPQVPPTRRRISRCPFLPAARPHTVARTARFVVPITRVRPPHVLTTAPCHEFSLQTTRFEPHR